jgi:MFS family permease
MKANHSHIYKNRTLVLIGTAEAISNIGDWITMLAIFALLVFKGGGGVAESSGIYLAGLLPALPASAAAGWLCDRVDKKWLMVLSQVCAGLSVVGLIFTDNLVLIYLLLAVEAIFISIMGPARQSAIPQLVAEEDLLAANAFMQQIQSIIKIFAPVLAGAVLAIMSPHQAIILDVISFSIATLMMLSLPSLPAHLKQIISTSSAEPEKKSISHWKVLSEVSDLRWVFLIVFLGTVVIIGFDVLASIYIRDTLHAGEQYYGLAIALVGLGAILSTFILMSRKNQTNPWWIVIWGLGLLGLIPSVMAAGAYLPNVDLLRILVLVGCLFGGIGNGFAHVQLATLLQTLTPSSVLGQMSGLYQSCAIAGQLVGILLTPILVPAILTVNGFFVASSVAMAALVAYLIFKQIIQPKGEIVAIDPAE